MGFTKIEEQRAPFLFIIFSVITFFLLPFTIVLSIAVSALTNPAFYARTIARANLVSTYVEAQTIKNNKKIQAEIEEQTNLEILETEYNLARSEYEDLFREYELTSRDIELATLKKSHEDLTNTSWRAMRDLYPDRQEFDEYKASELTRLENEIIKIEQSRQNSEEIVRTLKLKLDEATAVLDAKYKALSDGQGKAERIIDKNKNTMLGTLYADLNIMAPILNSLLEEHVIESQLVPEIKKIINFLTTLDYQRRIGAIKEVQSQWGYSFNRETMIELPITSINLYVDDGTGRKRHLLSDLFVKAVRETQGIQNRPLLITLFTLSESGIVELMGSNKLKEHGITVQKGVITIQKVVTGDQAVALERIMSFLQYKTLMIYFPALLLGFYVLYCFFSSGSTRKKLRILGLVFFLPSLVILGATVIQWINLTYFPETTIAMMGDETIGVFTATMGQTAFEQITQKTLLYFGPLLLLGLFLRKITGGIKRKEETISHTPR